MKKLFLNFALLILIFSSCKDKGVENPGTSNPINPYDTISQFTGLLVPNDGSVEINLSHVFKSKDIVLNTEAYVSAAGDTFNVEELRYYFTNLSFQKQSGEWVNLKNYHLVDFKTESTKSFTISKLPAGLYKSVRFMLGVDSLNNSSGLQEGALDPAWGMFWTWNTGYIFYRIMGRNPKTGRAYSFDLGGNENLPIVSIDLNSFKLKTKTPKLFLEMDVNEMFQNPVEYSFARDGYSIHTNTSSGAWKLALNMTDMVKVKKLE